MRVAALLLALGLTAAAVAETPRAALPVLTAEDRDGRVSLPIDALRVRVLIRGHLAQTTYDITFRNELDRDLDGQFAFPLPPDAEVSDLGLYFDGVLRHAVAVERVQARAAYEQTVHRRVDPALAEWSASTRAFRFRVYPIPARGTKVVHIAYDQDIASVPYELDLPHGLPPSAFELTVDSDAPVDERDEPLHARVRAERNEAGAVALAAWSPSEWSWYYSAPARIHSPARRVRPASAVTVLYDVSSSAVQRNDEALHEFLREFVALQREGVRVTVVPFHVRVDSAFETDAAALEPRLAALPRAGATNLAALVERLPAIVAAAPSDARIVLVTDGIHTMGDSRSLARALDGVARLDRPLAVVNASPSADDPVLARLAAGGWLLDLSRTSAGDAAAAAMRVPTRERVTAGTPRIRSVLPESVTLLSDVTMTMHARGPQRVSRLAIAAAGVPHELPVRELESEEERDLVRRSWARAALRQLLERGAPDREVLAHGLRFRQLTPQTSLLVLDTWRDYEMYGIPLPPELREQRERERRRADVTSSPFVRGDDAASRAGWFLKGTVSFDDGPLPGATVDLLVDGTIAATTVSDAEGRFWLTADRAPAAFTLRARLDGLSTATLAFPHGAPRGAVVELMMRLQTVSEAITVTAAAPLAGAGAQVSAVMRSASLVRPSPEALADPLLAQVAGGSFAERMQRIAAAVAHMQTLSSIEDRFRYYVAARSAIGGDRYFQAHAAMALQADAPELAVRALTDLVESYPDDAPTLRLIGRVLDGWGFGDLARASFERALELSPAETQTWRELLLLAAKEQRTADLDALQRRFAEARRDERMEQTEAALSAEMQRRGLDRRIDEASELQVELMWDSNYTDIDLRVREPDGEEISYQNPQGKRGGRLHADVISGFGPETYTLPRMEPGTYEIVLDYYGEDASRAGLQVLAHVIVYVRGERRDFFVPLAGQEDDTVV